MSFVYFLSGVILGIAGTLLTIVAYGLSTTVVG